MKKQEWIYREGYEPHFQSTVYDQETGKNIAVFRNDEGGKNALLASKAPELLEALESLIKTLEPTFHKMGIKKAFSELAQIAEAKNLLNSLKK